MTIATPEPQFDVFLSHSSADKPAVRLIRDGLRQRNVSVWFDEDQLATAPIIVEGVEQGLRASRAVVVCFGPTDPKRWHKAELQVAIVYAIEHGLGLVPIILPGGTRPPEERLSPFLRIRHWIEFGDRTDNADALDRLARLLGGETATGKSTAERTSRVPKGVATGASDAEIEGAIDELAAAARGAGSLTFFIAAGWSPAAPDMPPKPYEIATELLTELKLIDDHFDGLLLPLETAGSYYEVERPAQLVERVRQLIAQRSGKVPELYGALVDAVGRIGQLRESVRRSRHPGVPRLVVTTGLDLMCERAMLRAGTPFTRIVQHWTGTRLTINQYTNVQVMGDALIIAGPGESPVTVRRDDFGALDAVIEMCGRRTIPEGRSAASQSAGGDPIRELEFTQFQEPYLYKYHGSCDEPSSCALSTEHYLRLAAHPTVPDRIVDIISNSAALFLACGALDADVRHVYHTLLRRAYQLGDEGLPRYAIVRPPNDPELDRYKRLERSMWARAKQSVRTKMGVSVIEGDPQAFLRGLSARLTLGQPSRERVSVS